MDKILRRDYEDVYRDLPAATVQQILRLVEKNWKSFFKAIKVYAKAPEKFKGRPKLPKYKNKTKGLNVLIFTNQQVKLKDNYIHFPKKSKVEPLKTKVDNIQQVRIIPQAKSRIGGTIK